MSASASKPVSVFKPLVVLLAVVWLAGCAGSAHVVPGVSDESVLASAERALAKARAADADTFAPRAVDAARRRIATARSIVFGAARASRELTDTEQRNRVDQLIDAARLDAASALVQT